MITTRYRRAAATAALALAAWVPADAHAQLDPSASAALTLSDWAADLGGVTDVEFLSDGRGVIVMKGGEVAIASSDGTMLKRMATSIKVDSSNEKGLLGVVRDDSDNLYFYASSGPDDANRHEVWRGRAAADNTIKLEATPLVKGGLEGPANHDGGGLWIHKGQLYIGVGDTGANATPPVNKYGACLNKPNGKILRVNLDGTVPADNPLQGMAMVTACTNRTEGPFTMAPPDLRIYAWGMRNPWRFWIDPATDLLWIGDVGEVAEEEISVGGKGANHGWPFFEGKVRYDKPLGGLSDCKQMTPATDCVAPQDTYSHAEANAASVTGGLAPPAGCGWGDYEKKYFFADYSRHIAWTLDLSADRKTAVAGSRKKLADVHSVVSFRMGPGGAMYIVSNGRGQIKKLAPKTVPAGCSLNASAGNGGGGSGGASGSGGSGSGGSGRGGGAGPGTPGSGGSGSGGSSGSGGQPATAAGGEAEGCSCDLGGKGGGGAAAGLAGVLFAAFMAMNRSARTRANRRRKNQGDRRNH